MVSFNIYLNIFFLHKEIDIVSVHINLFLRVPHLKSDHFSI